jgi:hypothetical protein
VEHEKRRILRKENNIGKRTAKKRIAAFHVSLSLTERYGKMITTYAPHWK